LTAPPGNVGGAALSWMPGTPVVCGAVRGVVLTEREDGTVRVWKPADASHQGTRPSPEFEVLLPGDELLLDKPTAKALHAMLGRWLAAYAQAESPEALQRFRTALAGVRAAREADRVADALDELRDAAARVRRVARRAVWPLDDLGPLDAEVDHWLRLLEELEARLDGAAPPATSTTVLVIALGEPHEVQARPSLTIGQLVAGLRRSGRVDALRLVHVTDNSGRALGERELVAELAARSPLYVSYPIGWGG
jgi:hypothetical protein